MNLRPLFVASVAAIGLSLSASAAPLYFDIDRSSLPAAFLGAWCITRDAATKSK
jgi:hypothetical protein